MHRIVISVRSLLLLVYFGACSAPIFSQQVTGSILGNVQDAQGAVIPGADVAARNHDTGLARATKANERGEYRIDFLPPGNYEIQVSDKGFRSFVRSGIALAVGDFARVDARLEVGEATSTIEVTGTAPLVNTTESTVGQSVQTDQITTLPLVNRNIYSLLSVTPGVQYTANAIALGFPAQRTFINGGADATMGCVNYYLDGGLNMSTLRNTGNSTPNPDAIDEFRVDTNNYSAECGRLGNGVINVIKRSGTNDCHGSDFELLRNTKLKANTWNAITSPCTSMSSWSGRKPRGFSTWPTPTSG